MHEKRPLGGVFCGEPTNLFEIRRSMRYAFFVGSVNDFDGTGTVKSGAAELPRPILGVRRRPFARKTQLQLDPQCGNNAAACSVYIIVTVCPYAAVCAYTVYIIAVLIIARRT